MAIATCSMPATDIGEMSSRKRIWTLAGLQTISAAKRSNMSRNYVKKAQAVALAMAAVATMLALMTTSSAAGAASIIPIARVRSVGSFSAQGGIKYTFDNLEPGSELGNPAVARFGSI